MRHQTSNGDSSAQHSRAAHAGRQQQVRAQDMKARGDNPVRVSDVRQDASTRTTVGAAILSRLTS
jgi:hypothetical protein